jgi:hypothetical protein
VEAQIRLEKGSGEGTISAEGTISVVLERWEFTGDRVNDIHLKNEVKKQARKGKKSCLIPSKN